MAIFDQVSFGSGEDELAVRNIHLAATEVHRVNAAFHGTNNIVRIVIAGEHVSIGHARHGDVLVTFTASITGIGHAHQTRRELVAQIPLEDSFFDQNSFLCGMAFVIHIERSPTPGHGAVVHNRAFFAGDFLADQSGES